MTQHAWLEATLHEGRLDIAPRSMLPQYHHTDESFQMTDNDNSIRDMKFTVTAWAIIRRTDVINAYQGVFAYKKNTLLNVLGKILTLLVSKFKR